MNRKIVVIGGSGLLGTELTSQLTQRGYEVLAPTHTELDITDYVSVKEFIKRHLPDCVINAASAIDVDKVEEDPYIAWSINTLGAGGLARAIAASNKPIALIHLSSSYVFGDDKEFNNENDQPAPINVYGASKLAGEKLIITYAELNSFPYFIVRTSWLYGPSRDTFVDVIAKELLAGKTVYAANDYFGNPTNASHLSDMIINTFIQSKPESGIYHMFNNTPEQVSRFDIAMLIAQTLLDSTVLVRPAVDRAVTFSAKRPRHAVLINTKLPALPLWSSALKEHLRRYRQA